MNMNKHEWWSIEKSGMVAICIYCHGTLVSNLLSWYSWYTCIQSHCSQHTSIPHPQLATVLNNPHLIFSLALNLNCHIVPFLLDPLTSSIVGRVISLENIYGGGFSLGLWHWPRCPSSLSPPHLAFPSPYNWPWQCLGFNSLAWDYL